MEVSANYLIVKHVPFPVNEPHEGEPGYDPLYRIPSAKVLGAARHREHAFRLPSIVNISAMSYGSLSAPAVEAINRGCLMSECLHNTGRAELPSTTSTAAA